MLLFFFYLYGDHRYLHVLTHSFPTRRSSDLLGLAIEEILHLQRGGLRADARIDDRARQAVEFAEILDVLARCQPLVDPARVWQHAQRAARGDRSEEHTSELQSLMRISYAVFCLKKKTNTIRMTHNPHH